jgi:ABC-type maltose transport system permease subunit
MTDETPGTGPAEGGAEEPTPAAEHDMAAVVQGAGDFTSGEGLVAFAGIVVVATWLIFEVIVNEYSIAWVLLLFGVAAAVLPRLNRDAVEKVAPLPVLMKVLGYGIALMALFYLIEDLRFGVLDNVADILAGLITYAAGVMAFLGARQTKI